MKFCISFYPMRATWHAYNDVITPTISGQEYKSHSSSLWNFLKPPVQSIAAAFWSPSKCICLLSTTNISQFDSILWINLPLKGRLIPKEDNLTFMGPCIVSIFQYISNKMQRYSVYLYLETAPHVSGGTSIHHQERKQLYLQHLTPLLLSAAISSRLQ